MALSWIPLLASDMLEPNEVIQVFVLDHEVAVWRSASGQIQVWENRCPHRSVRLSLGRVEGESLVCAYHGWRFAAGHANCEYIPAQPTQRAPSTLCANAYAVRLQGGMIWFADAESNTSDPASLSVKPDHASQGSVLNDVIFCGSAVVNAGYVTIRKVLNQRQFIATESTDAVSYHWQGTAGLGNLNIYISPHHTEQAAVEPDDVQQATLHMVLDATAQALPSPDARLQAMLLLYAIRDNIEARITQPSSMEANSDVHA